MKMLQQPVIFKLQKLLLCQTKYLPIVMLLVLKCTYMTICLWLVSIVFHYVWKSCFLLGHLNKR